MSCCCNTGCSTSGTWHWCPVPHSWDTYVVSSHRHGNRKSHQQDSQIALTKCLSNKLLKWCLQHWESFSILPKVMLSTDPYNCTCVFVLLFNHKSMTDYPASCSTRCVFTIILPWFPTDLWLSALQCWSTGMPANRSWIRSSENMKPSLTMKLEGLAWKTQKRRFN